MPSSASLMLRRWRLDACRAAVALLVLAPAVQAMYLPGVAPREYDDGAKVELKVNKLISVKTQLPYGYYVLPFCRPEKIVDKVENLGEMLAGDMVENSPYEIRMRLNETCKFLCKQGLTPESKNKFKTMIDGEYTVNWIMDSLPAATRYIRGGVDGGAFTYANGFPAGAEKAGRYYVNNHVVINLQWHRNPDKYEGYRIVGFEVEPYSVSGVIGGTSHVTCGRGGSAPLFDLDKHEDISYTYDVAWTESSLRWASRWDNYLKMGNGDIHWFSIINSLIIVLLLSGMVAMILLRTLLSDITRYNEVATAEDIQEESGWKLVHGDVFRPPPHSAILAATVGSGVQILGMAAVTLIFAVLGFLSPAHRGGLLQSMMLVFTSMGVPAGYVSSRLAKVFGIQDYRIPMFVTATLYPGFVFVVFFLLNLLIWQEASSGAVPFVTMFAILVLWFGISVPLVFLGSYLGFRKDTIELPVRVNQLPRVIPAQPWYLNGPANIIMAGMLPFGAAFTELFFILSSIWMHQFYYLFGFLAIMGVLVIITSAEISIAVTYFQLAAEDYQWWWRSFFVSASSGGYVFMYSVLYFWTRLFIDRFVGTVLYFGYMGIVSCLFGLLTGSCGMLSSFFFVRAIYGSIKVD